MRRLTQFVAGLAIVAVLCFSRPAWGYIEAAYTLGRIITEATNVVLLKVEKTDTEKNLIIFRKVADIKGKHPTELIKHNIGRGGFHPREWQFIMAAAQPGKMALMFHNGSAAETCLDDYWYQTYPGGEWWNMNHGEPYLLRSYAGKPEKLATAVASILAGQEVIVPCLRDGDKNALQLRTAKRQRMKASLKKQDYDEKRDFAGWGGEEFSRINNMPGMAMLGSVGRLDPAAMGVAAADINGDGQPDLCLYSEQRVVVLLNGGNTFEEVPLPYVGGARAAAWGDYNGDGKPDLLLATPLGLKLFTNKDGKFIDDSAGLPQEPYYNLRSVAWIDSRGDGRLDILAANGFMGLRLYRNRGNQPQQPSMGAIQIGKWYYCGPFDQPDGKGFDRVYPPEGEIDLKKEYPGGKGGQKVGWKEGSFVDGQVNSFLPLFKPEHTARAVIYLYREIEVAAAANLPISLGSDDTLTVWLNNEKLIAEDVSRSCEPNQSQAVLKLKPGKNALLMKICNGDGEWQFYFAAQAPVIHTAPLFDDVSDQVGLGINGIGSNVKGDHLAVADVNGDGRQDFFYGAGDGVLALNTPAGFVEARDSGIKFPAGKISPIFADISGNHVMDMIVPLPTGCRVYKNDGKGHFTDTTAKCGDLAKFTGNALCVTAADFNNKGRNDLFFGCAKGPNRYFRNNGGGVFVDATDEIGLGTKVYNTHAIWVGDLNKDGVPDLVFANEGQDSVAILSAANRTGAVPAPAAPTTKPAK